VVNQVKSLAYQPETNAQIAVDDRDSQPLCGTGSRRPVYATRSRSFCAVRWLRALSNRAVADKSQRRCGRRDWWGEDPTNSPIEICPAGFASGGFLLRYNLVRPLTLTTGPRGKRSHKEKLYSSGPILRGLVSRGGRHHAIRSSQEIGTRTTLANILSRGADFPVSSRNRTNLRFSR
jgi:hypothetical protein